MRKKLIEELLLVSFFIIFITVLMINAFEFPVLARYAPFLIGGIALILLVGQFFTTFRKIKLYEREEISQEDIVKGLRLKGFMALLVLFLPATYFFGFVPVSGVILVIYFKKYADLSLVKSLLISLLTTGLVYLVFVVLLSIRLPEGIIW
ncbi:MAG: tripartite tricarboxylate transporter TctB family protein [Spirochaetota bacterium]